jgi:DNA repair protein RecN (Recombination protein N)
MESLYELQDARGEIENYLGNVEYDEERLNEIMYRLDAINQIKRKYADTIEGILEHYDTVSKKVDEIDNKEEHVKELEKEKKCLLKELGTSSQILHANRKELAGELQQRISNELKELCMPDATFVFDVSDAKDFNRHGKTDIQILFNANKGEELQSLVKVASGGELSRVLLAMKIAGNA